MTDEQLQLLRTIPETEITEMLASLGALKVDFPTENAAQPSQVEVNTDPCPVIEGSGKEPNTIRVKVISPGQGSSGYYSTEMLRRDMPKLIQPGLQMFWDHPKPGEPRAAGQRSIDRLAGMFTSVGVWENNPTHGPGVYADVKPLNGYGSRISELAKYNAFGLSILGEGLAREGVVGGRNTKVFETMMSINSVDFVTAAGRGGKVVELFEAAIAPLPKEKQEEPKVGLIQVDEAEYNGFKTRMTALEASVKELPQLHTTIEGLSKENVTLRAQGIISQKLTESGLKKAVWPKVTTELLSGVPMVEGRIDEAAFGTAIDTKVTEWLALVGKEVVTKFNGVTNMGESTGTGTTVVNLVESKKRGESAMMRLVPGYKVEQTA